LFPLFALAMDLPESFFSDKVGLFNLDPRTDPDGADNTPQTRSSAAMMKVLHYPPQTGPVDDRVIGIGAHTE
jgi:hypothetical protein